MEWKVTRFCEFSSENGRAESPLILTFCDGSQVWGYPSWFDLYPPGPRTEEPDESRD
jgi:hypothetical protein